MKISLSPGALGVKASQMESIDLAHFYGFDAVEPQVEELARMTDDGFRQLRDNMESMQVTHGAAGLRVDFRNDEAKFQDDLKQLPAQAKALQRAGVTRVGTWINPAHDTFTSRQYFDLHRRRLGAVADIFDAHGIRFGLEYVGPKTSWTSRRFPFLHTMAETRELIAAIGRKNVGLVLDSWHWYTAQEKKEDILALKNDDVVSVDLNDAPAGIPVDRQMDLARELPCATGVIDVAAFLGALRAIHFDGPVRPEPFNAALRKLPREQALQESAAAMRRAFAL